MMQPFHSQMFVLRGSLVGVCWEDGSEGMVCGVECGEAWEAEVED